MSRIKQHLAFTFAIPLAIATVTSTLATAQGAMNVAPSSHATTEITLTLVDSAARAASKPSMIRIDYGQPHLRGRKLLTDSLVPYDKAWRLGANGATMLTTDVDLLIGGMSVPKGKYVLQAMPSRTGWKLLVEKDVGQSPMAAAMNYDPANDVARVELRATNTSTALESLSIWLIPARGPGAPHGELRIAWGTVALATDWTMK
ncbi:MAG: DUF2911 domain-containing protein [Gemmatimonadota bacterium]|nr:DUF2911 domain-containing protein [Gemmatimonadota bacterium]